MSRITSIKELQATCNDLYDYFVERLSQVTEVETINNEDESTVCLHIVKTKRCDNCIKIIKWNNSVCNGVWFWADGWNGLLIGTYSDSNAIEISTMMSKNSNLVSIKQYTNKNGQKTADQKKRAVLLDLKAKLETLFKDYL